MPETAPSINELRKDTDVGIAEQDPIDEAELVRWSPGDPSVVGKEFPKMVYRVDPEPDSLRVENEKEMRRALDEGWDIGDNFTPEQLRQCVTVPTIQDLTTVDQQVANDAAGAAVLVLHNRIEQYIKDTNLRLNNQEKQIHTLIQELRKFQVKGPLRTDETNEAGKEMAQISEEGRGDSYLLLSAEFRNMLAEDPDKENGDLWTKQGAPDAVALSERLDTPVSKEERDKAWARFVKDESLGDVVQG